MSKFVPGVPGIPGSPGAGLPGPAPPEVGSPLFPGWIFTGGLTDDGNYIGDLIDVFGHLGDPNGVYVIQVVDGVLEIIDDDGLYVTPGPDLADIIEAEGIEYDDVRVGDEGFDPNRFIGPTTIIEPGQPPRSDGTLLPATGGRRGRPSSRSGVLKVIRAILEPSDRYSREGEEWLAEQLRRVDYIGPAWDTVRETLHEIVDPHLDDIKKSITKGDILPDMAEEAILDGVDYIRAIITLEAVPVPVPVPIQFADTWPGYDEEGVQSSWLGLLLLLSFLGWLSGGDQTPPPQSTTAPSQPPGDPEPEDEQGEQQTDQQNETDPADQPRIIPYPQPIGTPSKPPVTPEIDFRGGCVFVRLKPEVWVKYCPKIRARKHGEITVAVAGIRERFEV